MYEIACLQGMNNQPDVLQACQNCIRHIEVNFRMIIHCHDTEKDNSPSVFSLIAMIPLIILLILSSLVITNYASPRPPFTLFLLFFLARSWRLRGRLYAIQLSKSGSPADNNKCTVSVQSIFDNMNKN